MSDYRQTRRDKLAEEDVPAGRGPGPVELAVREEIAPAVEARPGLAQLALELARLMDDPRARNQKPAGAKALVDLLDELARVGAPRRRSHLALVREMTTKGGA